MRDWRIFLPIVPALAIVIAGPSALGEDFYSQEKCSLCHIRESVFFSPGFASPETLKMFGEERACFSCHNGTVRDSRDVLWRGAQHPPAAAGDANGPKRCSRCHSPHAKGGWSVLAGTSIPIRKGGDAVCTGCHPEQGRSKGAIHRTGFPDAGCAECHRAHGGTGKALLRDARRSICLRCHSSAAAAKSGGHPVARGEPPQGKKAFPECTACHPVHRAEAPGGDIDSECAGCHAFGKRAAGTARRAHPAEARCTQCHSFHESSGGKGRGLRRGDFRTDVLCGRCHAGTVAVTLAKGREKGTHATGSGAGEKDMCLRCHRIHDAAPGTALLSSAKSHSCLECHEGQNTISEVAGIVLAHPVFERVEKGRLAAAAKERRLTLGPGGEIVCRTCHAVHGAAPGTPLLASAMAGEGSCLFCHEGMGGRDHVPAGKTSAGPDCGICHPVHGKRQPAAAGGTADPWTTLCTSCHARDSAHVPGASAGGGGRPADLPGFDGRGRRLRTGAVSCPTCHDPHGAPVNQRLRRPYAPSAFVCTACHRDKEGVALTPHDLRGIAGRSMCEPCHRPHGGKGRWMWGVAAGGGEGGGECRSCHREKGLARAVPAGGHPMNVPVPRPVPETFPLFGLSGEQSRKGLITCATCHEVHGLGVLPLGEEGTGLLLRARAGQAADDIGRVRACLPCHQGKQAMHGQADCIWCHPPHDAKNAGPECGACHAMGEKGIARGHAENGRGCGTCHRIHGGNGGPAGAGACLGCHPKNGKVVGAAHGEMGGGPCRACHPAHEALEDKPIKRHGWEEIFAPDLPCLRCHRDEHGGPASGRGEHPKSRKTVPTSYGAVVTLETPIAMLGRLQEGGVPLFPLFDENGRAGLSGRMGCLTCHDPHAGNKMKDGAGGGAAGSYLRDPSGVFLAEICAPCHKDSAGEHARKFHEIPRKTE